MKELKEFVSINSIAIVDDEEEGFNDENKDTSSCVLNQIRELSAVRGPYNADIQARFDEIRRKFDTMSDFELDSTISALRQDHTSAKESGEESSEDEGEKSFGGIQDSCEIVKERRAKAADFGASTAASEQDSMGASLTHNPSNPTWYNEMQARLLSIKSRSSPILELSLDKPIVAGVQEATSTANPSEPSKFASFLMEVQQAGEPLNAKDQLELGGVRTGFNCKNGLNTEPEVFLAKESQEQFQCPPNGSLSSMPSLEKPKFTDKEPSINGGAFNAFIGPRGNTVGSSQSTPYGQLPKTATDDDGRHHKWSGHAAAQDDVIVEISKRLGPTNVNIPTHPFTARPQCPNVRTVPACHKA